MSVSSGFWFMAGALAATAAWWLVGRGWQGLRTQSRRVLAGCGAAILAAILLYSRLGSPQLLTAGAGSNSVSPAHALSGVATAGSVAGAGNSAASGKDAGSMDAVIGSLESRLRANGGSDGDWELLAKSYEFLNRADAAALARAHRLPDGAGSSAVVATAGAATGSVSAVTVANGVTSAGPIATPAAAPTLSADSERQLSQAEAARLKRDFKGAASIYAQLAARGQMSAQSWADYADVTASLNGNSLAGRPAEYVGRALALDPTLPKALWLQGSYEHESRQYSAAVATWRRLLAEMDGNSSDAKLIRGNIDEDTRLGGGVQQVASAAASSTAAAGGKRAAGNVLAVRGDVTVSPELKARVRAGQVLYIVAKAVNMPGMPAAVRRVETGAWPVQFELSDADAMVPERRLSAVGPVTIEARISQGGQANAAAGDLIGSTAPLDPAKSGALHLVIDREVR